MKAVVEANDLSHDRRGLLTRKQFRAGPEFGITLGPATSLNGGWEVFGRVSSDESGLLKLMEELPYITGRSLEAGICLRRSSTRRRGSSAASPRGWATRAPRTARAGCCAAWRW